LVLTAAHSFFPRSITIAEPRSGVLRTRAPTSAGRRRRILVARRERISRSSPLRTALYRWIGWLCLFLFAAPALVCAAALQPIPEATSLLVDQVGALS